MKQTIYTLLIASLFSCNNVMSQQQSMYKTTGTIERIDPALDAIIKKNAVIEMVRYRDEPLTVNFSVYLASKLELNYTYMANLFSEVTGTTIKNFIITHKIERVKELLMYDELNLAEIAYQVQYSSVAHLSAQFKKVTGHTPSHFKKLKEKRRNMVEDV